MTRDAAAAAVTARYERFAHVEALGRSAVYLAWAQAVADDDRLSTLIARIPEQRRQPPLVFAVARLLGAPETEDVTEWTAWVLAHADDLVAEASRRSLQTNEPLRCAALLPALALIEEPIALIELGASAGLCLYPDRYSYRYSDGRSLDPVDGVSPVELSSRLTGSPPLRMPDIVWRAGIDLAPLDATDTDDRRFLTTLVWPGEEGRAERISAAVAIVAADPPMLVAGDASDPAVVDALIAQAPRGARVVVTTPGMLPYIPRAPRQRLTDALREGPATWITMDQPTLHDGWTTQLDADQWDGFVLGVDGAPLALVDPLGAFVEWRAS